MTESSQAPLLKADVMGRAETPTARREQLLVEFERRGTSGQKFAELVGVKYQTFATWVQQRKRRRAATPKRKTPAKMRWLEATVSSDDDHDGTAACRCGCPVEQVWRFPVCYELFWHRTFGQIGVGKIWRGFPH